MGECKICTHPRVDEINMYLLSASPSFRKMTKKFRVKELDLHRHRALHLLKDVIIDGSHIISQLAMLEDIAKEILKQTTSKRGKDKDYRTALRTISEMRGIMQDYQKTLKYQRTETTINILVTPTWTLLKETIFNVLKEHPDARKAVAKSLLMIEDTTYDGAIKSV